MMHSYDLKCVNDIDVEKIFSGDEKEQEHISNLLKLMVKNWQHNNKVYRIIRYDKNYMGFDCVRTSGLFRSVILNDANKIVSFAPPKSVSIDFFMENNVLQSPNSCTLEEFIEGTMINVFYDESINKWEISTRSTVGGNISFFQINGEKTTFRDMFFDACKYVGLEFDMLDKKYCYSFVMQHPANRIVKPIIEMSIYLVSMYQINNESRVVHNIDYRSYYQTNECLCNTKIKMPIMYDAASSFNSIHKDIETMRMPYDIPGVMLHEPNGYRSKIRNPNYEYVKQLRGNQPKLQYQFLCLRKERKIVEYLKYYPEHKTYFETFRGQLHKFTNAVHSNYISCYIKKEKPLLEFPVQFRFIMYQMHQIYLNYLREQKLFVTKHVVIDYINQLSPSQQMHLLNYNFRQHKIDMNALCTETVDCVNV